VLRASHLTPTPRARSNDLTAGVRASARLLADTHTGVKGGAELVGATVAHTLLPAVRSRVLAEQGAPPGGKAARSRCGLSAHALLPPAGGPALPPRLSWGHA